MSDNTNQNQNQAPVSDDQELAKVLQGMQQETRSMAMSDPADKNKGQPQAGGSGMQYEQTPKSNDVKPSNNSAPAAKQENTQSTPPQPAPSQQSTPEPSTPSAGSSAPSQGASGSLPAPASSAEQAHSAPKASNPGLESLKKEALEELRPLVDKLDLPPKEKFDTMLLIIRSTDDQELLQPAHEAAKSIEDENQRAEALLDIVKEIDYFAGQK